MRFYFIILALLSSSGFAMLSKPRMLDNFEAYKIAYRGFLSAKPKSSEAELYAADAISFLLEAAEEGHPLAEERLYYKLQIPYMGTVAPDAFIKAVRVLYNSGNKNAELFLCDLIAVINTPERQIRALTGEQTRKRIERGSTEACLNAFFAGVYVSDTTMKKFKHLKDTISSLDNREEGIVIMEDLARELKAEYSPLTLSMLEERIGMGQSNMVLDTIKIKAENGSIRAAYLLGFIYIKKIFEQNDNDPQNIDAAIKWLEIARISEYNIANFNLAQLHHFLGDEVKALDYYQQVNDPDYITPAKLAIEGLKLASKYPESRAKEVTVTVGDCRTEEYRDLHAAFESQNLIGIKSRIKQLALVKVAEKAVKFFRENEQYANKQQGEKHELFVMSEEGRTNDAAIVKPEELPALTKVEVKSLHPTEEKVHPEISKNPKPTEKVTKAPRRKQNKPIKSELTNVTSLNPELVSLGTIFEKVKDTIILALSNGIVSEQSYKKFLKFLNALEGNEESARKTNGGSHYKINTPGGKVLTARGHRGNSDRTYTYAIKEVFKKIAHSYGVNQITIQDLGY